METALKVAKVTFRLIGWLLAGALKVLAVTLGALLGGSAGLSHNAMLQQSHELEHWSRNGRNAEGLYRADVTGRRLR